MMIYVSLGKRRHPLVSHNIWVTESCPNKECNDIFHYFFSRKAILLDSRSVVPHSPLVHVTWQTYTSKCAPRNDIMHPPKRNAQSQGSSANRGTANKMDYTDRQIYGEVLELRLTWSTPKAKICRGYTLHADFVLVSIA